ncbi:hypothetical protein [Dolichospermum sp. FACHB-1091]|nr:hypothetical protein [Dolichospermum sp. FACHB-1091]
MVRYAVTNTPYYLAIILYGDRYATPKVLTSVNLGWVLFLIL